MTWRHFLNNVYTHDRTKSIELNFQTRMLKDKAHPVAIYEVVKPVGPLWSRLYGLPKTHKDNVPVRLILSMVASVQHKLAKWLTVLLQPVQEIYTGNCIKHYFSFANFMQNCPTILTSLCALLTSAVSFLVFLLRKRLIFVPMLFIVVTCVSPTRIPQARFC